MCYDVVNNDEEDKTKFLAKSVRAGEDVSTASDSVPSFFTTRKSEQVGSF